MLVTLQPRGPLQSPPRQRDIPEAGMQVPWILVLAGEQKKLSIMLLSPVYQLFLQE